MNDSDSHTQLKDGMVVAMGQEVLHIEEVSAADELLSNWNGRSALEKMSNGSLHLDGIIGLEGEDDPLSTVNSGRISLMKKDENLQELKSKSEKLDNNQFHDTLVIRLPSYERYVPAHWRRTVQ